MAHLNKVGMMINLEKSKFVGMKVEHLGFELSWDGIRAGKHKVSTLEQFPVPQDLKFICHFLGLIGFFWKLIPNFSAIARPLFDLMKKDNMFERMDEWQKAYEELCDMLIGCVTLQYPNPKVLITVDTYAGKLSLGVCLSQPDLGTKQSTGPLLSHHVHWHLLKQGIHLQS